MVFGFHNYSPWYRAYSILKYVLSAVYEIIIRILFLIVREFLIPYWLFVYLLSCFLINIYSIYLYVLKCFTLAYFGVKFLVLHTLLKHIAALILSSLHLVLVYDCVSLSWLAVDSLYWIPYHCIYVHMIWNSHLINSVLVYFHLSTQPVLTLRLSSGVLLCYL